MTVYCVECGCVIVCPDDFDDNTCDACIRTNLLTLAKNDDKDAT